MLGNLEMHMRQRSARNDSENHAGFLRRAVTFLDVALQASGSDVVPRIDSASRTGNDVVDCQVRSPDTAILTSVIVSVQDVAP